MGVTSVMDPGNEGITRIRICINSSFNDNFAYEVVFVVVSAIDVFAQELHGEK